MDRVTLTTSDTFEISMTPVYLLLGSNETDRFGNLEKACELIELRCGKVVKQSALYETEAWGLKEQNAFINQAVQIETSLAPKELLFHLKAIEKEIGRVETVKWGPRVIDIDILFYGNEIVDTEELKVPHPFLHERRFTLAPLNEIAAEFVHPLLQRTVSELLNDCPDTSVVKKLNWITFEP